MANPAARSDRFVADDLERVQQERTRVEATGEPLQHGVPDARARRADGLVPGRGRPGARRRGRQPVFWQGIMYDVTRQRESEARARETETRYRALVEQLPAIVYSEAVIEATRSPSPTSTRA